ncbi:hypothetical protein EVAR_58474_1 [Eumeta japonica]|uniref:Uncharacterized protein n=1 Tax=Eumeta variegata TaxID=151549 RepID=A0A4C1YNR2_EUMVA|nr:hypothetical protein EVAR_58474_1 [Eumeta japonica]
MNRKRIKEFSGGKNTKSRRRAGVLGGRRDGRATGRRGDILRVPTNTLIFRVLDSCTSDVHRRPTAAMPKGGSAATVLSAPDGAGDVLERKSKKFGILQTKHLTVFLIMERRNGRKKRKKETQIAGYLQPAYSIQSALIKAGAHDVRIVGPTLETIMTHERHKRAHTLVYVVKIQRMPPADTTRPISAAGPRRRARINIEFTTLPATTKFILTAFKVDLREFMEAAHNTMLAN